MRSNKSARSNFDTSRVRRRQRTNLGWRVEEEEASSSASPRSRLRLCREEAQCRAGPSPRVDSCGQGQKQGQVPFSSVRKEHDVDCSKKRSKDPRQVFVEAVAVAAAGRKEENGKKWRGWINRAKQDPGMWREEEGETASPRSRSRLCKEEAQRRADLSQWNGRVAKPHSWGQGQVPFSSLRKEHDIDRPKKRQKDARHVVVETVAEAVASASAAGRGHYFRRLMAMRQERDRERERLGIKLLMRMTTREWINRAKQDPGMWSGHDVAEKCLSKCKFRHKEAETARKHGPNPNEENCYTTNADFLPLHLIFARLPLRQLFQLRCVCKLWKLMLNGDALALLPQATNLEQEEYWFVMSRPLPYEQRFWSFRAFSTLDGCFFQFPLPTFSPGKLSTLLGGMGCSLLPRLERNYKVGSHLPHLASAGGLMCAFVHKPDALDDYHVIVFNCLTGSVKVLPPLLDLHYLSTLPNSEAVGCNMYMSIDDEDPSRYYIMVTHLERSMVTPIHDSYYEIFDSRKGCWRAGHAIELATADSKVSHGDFFFMFVQWNSQHIETVLAYRAADDLWSKLSVPQIKLDGVAGCWVSGCPVISKYKGRLQQCLTLSSGRAWLGFGVWELQVVSLEAATWVEVARTPLHIWKGLSCGWEYKLMAEGSLLWMAFEDREHQGHFQPPLVYDMAQSLWHFLPGSVDFGCISVYRPRLSLHVPHLEGEE